MNTCHNMNIVVQNTGGDASSLNGVSKIPNKALANIKRALLLNSSHKKELCQVCLSVCHLALLTN